MWPGRKAAAQRPSAILIIDRDEAATADLAQRLGALGSHVFYTAAPHVARRLSQEHYFDLVIVDDRIEGMALSDVVARDGHRCVVLSVDPTCERFETDQVAVRGALRRPLQAERLHELAAEVVRNASFEGYSKHLDLVK